MMALPRTLTAEFTEAVDNLVQDPALLDSTLHSRAQQLLAVFDDTNPAGSVRVEHQVRASPAWEGRVHQIAPTRTPFTTPRLFDAMYGMAEELSLVAGKRYVSAAICVCGEHATAHVDGDVRVNEERRARLAHALHELSSTWVAFLLWPFYARAQQDTTYSWMEDLPDYEDGDTPTAEGIARAQAKARRRRCEELVRERDDYRCFMTGVYDSKWCHRRPFPADARFLNCGTVQIIPSELWAHEDADLRDAILGMLARFGGVPGGGPALAEKAAPDAPRNTLLVYVAATDAFEGLLWSLHPTETPNRYEIKSYRPPCDEGCRHITSHVAFADHSPSPCDGLGVELPDRALLRAHAALAGVLHRSGARRAFVLLRYRCCREASAPCPGASGGAFWRSVVEYAGPEACVEVGEALRRESGPVDP